MLYFGRVGSSWGHRAFFGSSWGENAITLKIYKGKLTGRDRHLLRLTLSQCLPQRRKELPLVKFVTNRKTTSAFHNA
jgi:hypothetical protein